MMALITGSRWATVADHGQLVRDLVLELTGPALDDSEHALFVGDCDSGVDFLVRQIFGERAGWFVDVFEAAWEECGAGCPKVAHRKSRRGTRDDYCPFAGPRRNRRMATTFAAAGGKQCLALPDIEASLGYSGTWGCAREAAKVGLDVRVKALKVVRSRG